MRLKKISEVNGGGGGGGGGVRERGNGIYVRVSK